MTNPANTLILAIVQPEDAPALLTALARDGCGATYLAARGGFLRHHAVALLVFVANDGTPVVLRAIKATCARRTAFVTPVAEAEFGYVPEPIEVEIGGAVVFGLPAGRPAADAFSSPAPARDSAPPPASPQPAEEEIAMLDRQPTTLLVAVVPDRLAGRVVAALVERRFGATTIGSTGGFLRRGNTTILTGVPAEQAEEAARLIQATCRQEGAGEPAEGGGVTFALPVDWRLRL